VEVTDDMSSTEPQTDLRPGVGSSGNEQPPEDGMGPVASEETAGATASAAAPADVAPTDVTSAEAIDPGDGSQADGEAPSGKQPTRLMADLTRAMQTAALTARAATMEQFNTEAKAQTESVHQRAAEEVSELRQRAEDDIAAIRDWSKAEMARVREETEQRISGRRTSLEHELEAHAARVERRLEILSDRVKAYEARMDRFFETLMAEDNAARIASMAEQMPEPPPFDDIDAHAGPFAVEASEPVGASSEQAVGTATPGGIATALSADGDTDGLSAWGDPRLAAIGADGEPGEAAASPESGEAEAGPDVPEMDDETLAARLAGILPDEQAATPEAAEPVSTQVKVIGLVSVAAIAGFKRSLSRLEGVTSVGVSSGPDGHFLFAVVHVPTVVLRDVIPTFPGFEARVTGGGDGALEVTARDPEAGS
jgi:hypothetical protein